MTKSCVTRTQLIAEGLLIPHPDLEAQYMDGTPGPSFSQPWHHDDLGARLDPVGRFWAAWDVQQSVNLDYGGFAPSYAAGYR